jgi:predicted  nucleic acid-binding Zn-ribbon protein
MSENQKHTEGESELPKWACPDCGKIFRAITQDSLNDKAKNHLDDCDVDLQSGIEGEKKDAEYNVTLKAPRDPDAYEMSEHFHSMYIRRNNPSADGETINSVLRKGVIKSTHVSGRYLFDHRHDGWRWCIIVKLVDDAFYKANEKHIAITLFSPESDSHDEVTKYV